MDDAIGLIVDELKNQGILENTIIVFTADNGGQVDAGGNNYPLRGNKGTLWEGGMRSSAFVYSNMIKDKGTISNDLIHVVDWTPTLLGAVRDSLSIENQAKVDEFLSEERDGVNQWNVFIENEPSRRSELLYNIDGNGAIRVGDLKLIRGNPGGKDGHYPPANLSISDEALQGFDDTKNNHNVSNYIINGQPIYLFNLAEDPYEYNNTAQEFPDIVEEMMNRLEAYEATMIPPHIADLVEEGNPSHFGGVWSPGWCESEPQLHQGVDENEYQV